MSHSLRRQFPDLPADFVERIRRKGRQIMSLQEIAEEWKEYQKEKEASQNGNLKC